MIEFSEFWLVELVRATLVLSIAVLLAKYIFRFTQAKPQTRVLTWMLVLAPCWLMFSFTLEIPWLESGQKSGINGVVVWSNPNQALGSTPASAVETATIAPQTNRLSATEWIAISLLAIWASGIIFLLSKYLRSYWRMQGAVRQIVRQSCSKPPLPVAWVDEFEKAKREIGLRRDVQLLISDGTGPLLCWFRGRNFVIVPANFWKSSTGQQRSAILLHELAHAKRFDVWWLLVARILILPQWFNPFAWYALRRLSESVEMACDDEVLKHSEFGRFEYAKSLVSLVEFNQSEVSFGLPAIGPPVQQRIQRIVHPNGVEMKFTRMIVIGSLVLIWSFGLVRPELVAQNAEPKAGSSMTEGAPQPLVAVVSTADDGAKLKVVSYDVSDLVLFPPRAAHEKKSKNELGGITLSDFVPILDLIKQTVAPDSWGENGKAISPYVQNLTLVVTQTSAVHEEIQDVLTKLRGLDQFSIELNSFMVLVSKDSDLLPVELGENGKSIEAKVVQKLHDAEDRKTLEYLSIPDTSLINGQSVVYQNLDKDLWSVEALSVSAIMSASRESTILRISGMTELIFAVPLNKSRLNKMVDGQLVELEKNTIMETMAEGIESKVRVFPAMRVQKFISVAKIEDGKFLALDVSSMLKKEKQDRRAILIVKAKIKDNQKREGN